MTKKIVNKVAESGLVTLELKDLSNSGEKVELDIKQWLLNGSVLKERMFRNHLKSHNWSQYADKYVAVYCSEDAIIPVWSYMLVASFISPYAKHICFGKIDQLEQELFQKNIEQIDLSKFIDKRVLIKGCSDIYIPDAAYVMITSKLLPVVKSLMFGEACSNVPIFKKKN